MDTEQIKTQLTQLDSELKAIFGDNYTVRACLGRGLCDNLATVTVHGNNPANNIWQNSPAILNLICFLDRKGTGNKLSWDYLGHTTVREYRKISGTDLATINGKLVEKIKGKYKAIMDQQLNHK